MNISTTAFTAMRTALDTVDMAKVGSTIKVASNIAGKKALQIKNSFLEQHKAGPNELTSKILSTVMAAFESGRGTRDVEHTESSGSFRMDGAAHGADQVNYEREAANPTVMSFLAISDKAGKLLLSLGKSVAEALTGGAAQPPQDPTAAREARNASFASRSSLGNTLRYMATAGSQNARTQQGTAMPTSPPGMSRQSSYTPGNGAPPPSGPPPRANTFAQAPQGARASTYAYQPWANTPPAAPHAGPQPAETPPPLPPRPGSQPNPGRPRASSAPPPRPESPLFADQPWAETETPPPRPPKEPFGDSRPSAEQPKAKATGSAKVEVETPATEREKTPYEQLGIDPTATPSEIRKAYKKAALETHPDKNEGTAAATEQFKAVKAAYDLLSDPNKRMEYDEANR